MKLRTIEINAYYGRGFYSNRELKRILEFCGTIKLSLLGRYHAEGCLQVLYSNIHTFAAIWVRLSGVNGRKIKTIAICFPHSGRKAMEGFRDHHQGLMWFSLVDNDVWIEASVISVTPVSQMWCVHWSVAVVVSCYCDISASLVCCLRLWFGRHRNRKGLIPRRDRSAPYLLHLTTVNQ
jgi:hypothetical protein